MLRALVELERRAVEASAVRIDHLRTLYQADRVGEDEVFKAELDSLEWRRRLLIDDHELRLNFDGEHEKAAQPAVAVDAPQTARGSAAETMDDTGNAVRLLRSSAGPALSNPSVETAEMVFHDLKGLEMRLRAEGNPLRDDCSLTAEYLTYGMLRPSCDQGKFRSGYRLVRDLGLTGRAEERELRQLGDLGWPAVWLLVWELHEIQPGQNSTPEAAHIVWCIRALRCLTGKRFAFKFTEEMSRQQGGEFFRVGDDVSCVGEHMSTGTIVIGPASLQSLEMGEWQDYIMHATAPIQPVVYDATLQWYW
jgi:hypothetical protein